MERVHVNLGEKSLNALVSRWWLKTSSVYHEKARMATGDEGEYAKQDKTGRCVV